MPLKENGVVSFNSKDNANTFCKFFSNLADSLNLQNNCGIKTSEEYYKQIRNNYEDFVSHNEEVRTVDKVSKN